MPESSQPEYKTNKDPRSGNLARQIKAGVILLLLCIVLIFALQNSDSVHVIFLAWTLSLPGVLLFFVFFSAGFIAGLAVSNWKKMTRP